MLACQLILDPPGDGAWNMAVDDALLDRAANEGVATLRFYEWNEATLSLGYFQRYDDRHSHAESKDCPVVRRHSGGGAIVHDRELTYSLALPRGSHPSCDPHALYWTVHQSLRETLVSLGGDCSASLCRSPTPLVGGAEPFLCFLRRARGDLLVESKQIGLPQTVDGHHKVAGSSQRKRRGAVLQHGSLLLQKSQAAPQLPGLAQLVNLRITASNFAKAWVPRLSRELSLAIEETAVDDSLGSQAEQVRDNRFAQPAWSQRR